MQETVQSSTAIFNTRFGSLDENLSGIDTRVGNLEDEMINFKATMDNFSGNIQSLSDTVKLDCIREINDRACRKKNLGM